MLSKDESTLEPFKKDFKEKLDFVVKPLTASILN